MKVPRSMESPLDHYLYELADPVIDKAHFSIPNLTPNMITTVGLILGICSLISYVKGKTVLSIIFLWLYYFSDCMDGHYARKYDKVTKFGDYYDHFRDWFVAGTLIILVMIRLRTKWKRIVFISLSVTLLFASIVYIGCQESIGETHGTRKVLPEDSSPSLQWSKTACPNATDTVKVARFLGHLLLSSFYRFTFGIQHTI